MADDCLATFSLVASNNNWNYHIVLWYAMRIIYLSALDIWLFLYNLLLSPEVIIIYRFLFLSHLLVILFYTIINLTINGRYICMYVLRIWTFIYIHYVQLLPTIHIQFYTLWFLVTDSVVIHLIVFNLHL